MEAYFFVEELPLALEYGMTPHQFWEEDMDLFYAYQKAYVNRIHKKSHIEALYQELAVEIALANSFKKESDKRVNFPETDIYNPFNEKGSQTNKNELKQSVSNTNTTNIFHIKRKIEENSKKGE